MKIIGWSSAHDGSFVSLENSVLKSAIEGEKDSRDRFAYIETNKMKNLLLQQDFDVLASIDYFSPRPGLYWGVDKSCCVEEKNSDILQRAFQIPKSTTYFLSSHERAHILSAYGMSPWPQGQPCYVLCWEGVIGRFSRIDENLNINLIQGIADRGTLNGPGVWYQMIYPVAQPKSSPVSFSEFSSYAGKIMALTGFAKDKSSYSQEIAQLLNMHIGDVNHSDYGKSPMMEIFRDSSIHNVGIENQVFKDFAHQYSQAIFDNFYTFAKKNLTEKLPLLITGGCGLNCDWNTQWKESGLFSDVFIPPVPNDSGQGIGLAIDAQLYYTGNAKIKWTPYAGEDFMKDADNKEYTISDLDLDQLALILKNNEVVAWVQGKYEIGPRALCHRSLLASPFDSEIHSKLNSIKHREMYRPIAPVCTEEDVSKYFDWQGPSPYMLHFMKVRDSRLKAVTHVDGTARAQTITREQDSKTYDLLKAFEKVSGVPVLCNTSLNFSGKGFINRMSDLLTYVRQSNIRTFVVNDKMYRKVN